MKNNKNNDQKVVEQGNDILKFIYIFITIIVILLITYLLTNSFVMNNNKDNDNDNNSTPASIQYYEIMAGQVFNKNNDTYYVLFDKQPCSDCVKVENKLVEYQNSQTDSIPFYLVDMNLHINNYALYDWEQHEEDYGEDDTTARNDKKPDKSADLEIAEFPTLIKIKNGRVASYMEDVEEIIEHLDDLMS